MQTNHINQSPEVTAHSLEDDGVIPNNPALPLVLLGNAIAYKSDEKGDPAFLEKIFARNGWVGGWRNGIYPFHHYHSTAHEVLGVYSGSARVQFGGESGPAVPVSVGDVVIIPAGVAHRNIWSSHDFRVVGAYPEGQSWDMNYGKKEERPAADSNIEEVPLPAADPVYGETGALMIRWKGS